MLIIDVTTFYDEDGIRYANVVSHICSENSPPDFAPIEAGASGDSPQ